MRSPWVAWTLATLLVFGVVLGISELHILRQQSVEAQPANAEVQDATVSRVVDGDTIEVSPPVQGAEDVRLIGVDTPEVFGGEEPCGPEASAFTKEQLTGEQIQLEFDEERTDQYDRALAYVYLDGEMFNETLVREGYAEVATFPPNVKYEDRFIAAEDQAKAAGVGLWGRAGSCATSRPAPEPTTPAALAPAPEPAPSPPEPTPRDGSRGGGGSDLMEAGGPMEPPYPTMMDGSCPEESPVRRADGCYPR